MSKISKSPQRNTFQKEGYVKRCEKEGKEPDEAYLDLFKTMKQQDEENLVDPEWQKDNLEYDLRSTEWICDKVKASDSYAQNLYAAMCNMQFQQQQVWPVLKDQRWSCSWRHAGGIVADMKEKGDYIDWYCSGIAGGDEPDVYTEGYDLKAKRFVPEGTVTDEIRADLLKLGWVAIEWKDEKT
jgi:hypothetical protein